MFNSSRKRNDPYGVKPKARTERYVMTHGDPVTINQARQVLDSRPKIEASQPARKTCPPYSMHDPVYWANF